ncbi:MAG: polyphenol oxidase family protein [Holosporales bacterium]|nr:polyphenol oxidase family protein [Holosporales bacterium]
MNLVRNVLLSEVAYIDHGFFDRTGGVSVGDFESLNFGFARGDDDQNVLVNRRIVAEHFGIPLSNLITLNQKHGDTVHVINPNNVEEYKFKDPAGTLSIEGDAIVTNIPGLLIGIHTADCAPILLYGKGSGCIAAIHAGWRGALGNIIEHTISTLFSLGNDDIIASIGPCLQRDNFSVGDDIIARADNEYLSNIDGQLLFDMQAFVIDKLLRLGVKEVSATGIDTFSQENYFSYRRQNGHCGVQFSGIMLREREG